MVTILFDSVRRWWQAGAAGPIGLALSAAAGPALAARPAIAPRRVAPRAPALARRLPAKPLTPFGALARARTGLPTGASSVAVSVASSVASSMASSAASSPARRAARHFWITLDPQDRRHAALGGSFAEVCAALEQLAALEERRL